MTTLKPIIDRWRGPPEDIVLETTKKKINVYVCPTPNCGNYYGVAGMPNLSREFTGPKVEDRAHLEEATGSQMRHTRAECPDCRANGIFVERVLVAMIAVVPQIGPSTPKLPPSTNKALVSQD